MRRRRVGGQLDVAQALGDAHVVGVDHAGHALAHRAQVVELGVDERARVEGCRSRGGYRPGMPSCGCVSSTWYCSTNASSASFQFTGSRHAYHHSARSDSTFQASRMVATGSMHCAQRRGVVVEVDPGAAAPDLAPHRHEVDVAGLQVVLGERPRLRDDGVRAVGAVAPAVERAGEPALARAAALDDPDATVAAGVLEGPHPAVVGAHDDDRLVEDLVLDEVAGARDLLEPAGHLPDPGPELLGLQREEVGVEVALLGDPVRDLHRVGHRERRPRRPHPTIAIAARPPGRSTSENYTNRSVQ